jgi:hypothetical protein
MYTHVYEELIVPVLCIAHANWVMDDGLLPGTVFSMLPITPHHAAGIADESLSIEAQRGAPGTIHMAPRREEAEVEAKKQGIGI